MISCLELYRTRFRPDSVAETPLLPHGSAPPAAGLTPRILQGNRPPPGRTAERRISFTRRPETWVTQRDSSGPFRELTRDARGGRTEECVERPSSGPQVLRCCGFIQGVEQLSTYRLQSNTTDMYSSLVDTLIRQIRCGSSYPLTTIRVILRWKVCYS